MQTMPLLLLLLALVLNKALNVSVLPRLVFLQYRRVSFKLGFYANLFISFNFDNSFVI